MYLALFAELREQHACFEGMQRQQGGVFGEPASRNAPGYHVLVTKLEQEVMSTDHHVPCVLTENAYT